MERCHALVHLVDLTADAAVEARVETVRSELEAYSPELAARAWILVGTKLDALAGATEPIEALEAAARSFGVDWMAVSAVTGAGMRELRARMFELGREESRG